MFTQILRLFWIIIIVAGAIKVFSGLPWALGGEDWTWKVDINIPKKKVNIYFILAVLLIQCIYSYFFLYDEIKSVLQFSFGVGIPIGMMGMAIYHWVYKRKKEGKTTSPFLIDEDNDITELLDMMRKSCPENKLAAFEEESRKISTEFAQEPKKNNAGFLNISWKDYLNNALGFSAIFFAAYIFFIDFFKILLQFFIK